VESRWRSRYFAEELHNHRCAGGAITCGKREENLWKKKGFVRQKAPVGLLTEKKRQRFRRTAEQKDRAEEAPARDGGHLQRELPENREGGIG